MHERELLTEHELQELLPHVVSNASFSITIASAFLKKDVLAWLSKYVPKNVTVRVLSRWRKEDLLGGSSDLDVYDICRTNGWKFLIDQKLHAKVIMVDHSCLIIGSSNYTKNGLGFNQNSNLELNIKVIPNENEVARIDNFLINAYELDDATYATMSEELKSSDTNAVNFSEWSKSILFKFNTFAEKLWISECLTLSPQEFSDLPQHVWHNDKALWGANEPSAHIAKQMRVFNWLDNELSKEVRVFNFGELSSLLHSSIINDPSPYRKEIKECVAALFDWVEELNLYKIVQFRRTKGMIKQDGYDQA